MKQQYGFFIDLSRCIGCNACVISCKQWHDIAPGPVKWMRVYQWEQGAFPDIDLRVLPIPCLHCARPVCAEACPNKAITKEEKYGAVLVAPAKCTGQRKCWEACPYGAPQFAGDAPGEKMSKCTMCFDRLEQGLKPLCVLSCSMRALEFGPLDELRKKYSPRLEKVRPGFPQCRVSCPANLDAPGYIQLIAEGKISEALEHFRQDSPFAGVLGRVCTRPCEEDCLRGQFDDALPLRALKRFMADSELKAGRAKAIRVKPTMEHKVAIIGSGPAGLSCAYDLVRQGYPVTVFEAEGQAGGLMRLAIPEYRLSKEVLDNEISYIEELGVEIRINSRIEHWEHLFSQGYQAVFVATGAWQGAKMGVPGEDSAGVLYAIDFLKSAKSGVKVPLGRRVVVIGGGSVAVDSARVALHAARVAKRQGAGEVHLVCRKDRIKAEADEVRDAEQEGVVIHLGLGVSRILNENGRATGLELVTNNSESQSTLAADTVIIAIGQEIGSPGFLSGLQLNSAGRPVVDPVSLATSVGGVFAGGDITGGGDDIISAIAAGKAAAVSIVRYLLGENLKHGRNPLAVERALRSLRRSVTVGDYTNWDDKTAIARAGRCLRCGTTTPAVIFKPVDPKEEIVPWDARKALALWQRRHPDNGEILPEVFTDPSEVTADHSAIMGRKELVLKPKTAGEMLFYTTDDE